MVCPFRRPSSIRACWLVGIRLRWEVRCRNRSGLRYARRDIFPPSRPIRWVRATRYGLTIAVASTSAAPSGATYIRISPLEVRFPVSSQGDAPFSPEWSRCLLLATQGARPAYDAVLVRHWPCRPNAAAASPVAPHHPAGDRRRLETRGLPAAPDAVRRRHSSDAIESRSGPGR